MTQTVLAEKADGVLTLTINRPERRNALDVATYLGLAEQIWGAGQDKDVRAVVLTGANNYFTAGNDLKDFQGPRPDGDSAGIKFLRSLADCDLPVIAAVEGSAIGIGVTLLQHCDFIYAADNVTFKIPFVPLGLCPEGASSMLMAQIVGDTVEPRTGCYVADHLVQKKLWMPTLLQSFVHLARHFRSPNTQRANLPRFRQRLSKLPSVCLSTPFDQKFMLRSTTNGHISTKG